MSGVTAGRPTKKHARSKSILDKDDKKDEEKRDGEKDKEDREKEDGEKEIAAASEVIEGTRGSRPRRVATLVTNCRIGSPKTMSQLRALAPTSASASASILRKRRATDADLSVASIVPPGPSPSKKAKANVNDTRNEDEQPASYEPEINREDVLDALELCEMAFRQLRKALRV